MPPARAALFVTCLVDLLHPEVGEATAALLEDLGVRVEFPEGQTCCGQPPFNSGFHDDARRMGRALLDAFAEAEAVVTPSGSCATMVRRHYPHLFDGTPDAERARDLAARTYELSEFLVDVLQVRSLEGRFPVSATYHDACHGLRELGIGRQGRTLLAEIDGLELVEMADPEMCCGFGGTFAVRLPEMATAIVDEKLDQAKATQAEVLIAGDAGCLMHMQGRLDRTGSALRTMHLAVLLAEARGLVSENRS